MGSRTYSYDSKLLLSDNGAAYTASGIGKVGGASAIIDLGGADPRSDLGIVGGVSRLDGVVVLDIPAITTATDGVYRLTLNGSNNSDGSLPVPLATMILGLGSSLPNGSAAGTDVAGTGSTSTAGRREMLFSTEQNDVIYEYAYLYVEVLGTTSKSINVHAFIAPLPRE